MSKGMLAERVKRQMNIKLHYVEEGQGEPLLLLHGNGEDGTYFVHQIAYFSKKYRVIAIDTRGHGKSPRGDQPFTIRQFADDLYQFMQLHQIEKAHILGFSDGGNIAMIFAMKYPQCVKKLILDGANLDGHGVKAGVQIPIVLGYQCAALFAKVDAKAKKKAELLGLMVNDPNVKPAELKQIKAKTLVIAGTDDMIKGEHTKLIADNIPNAVLQFVEGDHFIANKEYQKFNCAVEQFLND